MHVIENSSETSFTDSFTESEISFYNNIKKIINFIVLRLNRVTENIRLRMSHNFN